MNNKPMDNKTSYAMGILTTLLLGINLFFGVAIWVLVRGLPMPVVPFFLVFFPVTMIWWWFWSKVPL
jgi:hypothetical protein